MIVARDWYALAKKIAKDREEIRSLFQLSHLNKIEDFSEVVDRAERRFFCLLDHDNFHYELSDYAKGIRAEESRKRRERQEGQNAEEDTAENKRNRSERRSRENLENLEKKRQPDLSDRRDREVLDSNVSFLHLG